jgi:hypothetical protein
MNFSIRHRIEKLEAVDMRLAKRIVWEDGSGSAEREIARLDAVGELDGVELSDEAKAATKELMRKFKAAREHGDHRK